MAEDTKEKARGSQQAKREKKGMAEGRGHYHSLEPLSHNLRRKSCGWYV